MVLLRGLPRQGLVAGDDQHEPKQRRHPVVLDWVVDHETGGIGGGADGVLCADMMDLMSFVGGRSVGGRSVGASHDIPASSSLDELLEALVVETLPM